MCEIKKEGRREGKKEERKEGRERGKEGGREKNKGRQACLNPVHLPEVSQKLEIISVIPGRKT